MNIQDLETCEIVEFDNQIIGGAQTYVGGNATAKQGKAKADVLAVSLGKNTSTRTKTNANVSKYSSVSSYVGSAVSQTKDDYSVSYDHGTEHSY
ncbi:MAG: hypothetical protein SWZ49_16380 [Cyanobacteriota bacterium]|nr:hypothetical protein [Cyanobacteriota bacterium]